MKRAFFTLAVTFLVAQGLAVAGVGKALSFNGTDGYLVPAANIVVNGGSYTLEAWIKPISGGNANATDKPHGIFGTDRHLGASWCSPHLAVYAGTSVRHGWSNSTNTKTEVADVLTEGKWNHLASVWNQSTRTLTLYVNGGQVDQQSFGGTDKPNKDIKYIGRQEETNNTDTFYYFEGEMDELRCWNVARTMEEISGAKDEKIDPATSGLVAVFHCDDDSVVTSVPDSVASTYTATVNGGVTWVDEPVSYTPVIGFNYEVNGDELSWTAENEDGVQEYIVEVKTAEGWKALQTFSAGMHSYSMTIDTTNTYRIVTVDHSGFSQAFAVEEISKTIFISLTEGWNLLSLPLKNASLAELLSACNGIFWGWNGASYVKLAQPKPLEGFWVYCQKEAEIEVAGQTLENGNVSITKGWNLLGVADNFKVQTGLTVFSWEQQYEQVLNEFDVMVSGRGYWIYSSEQTELEMK